MTDKELQDMFDEVAEKVGPLKQTDAEMKAEAHKWIDENDCFVLSCGSKDKDTVEGMFFLRENLKDEMSEEEGYKLCMNVITTLVGHKPHLFKEALDIIAKQAIEAKMNDPIIKKLMDELHKHLNPDGDNDAPADNDERINP